MKIKIYYIGIKLTNYESDSYIEVPDNCSAEQLLAFIGVPENRRKAMIVMINDEPIWNATKVKENDYVKLFPRMGGG
ncbi:MAG: MoaD/ThiS family protein [Dehalococcoidia bacterium]|jgi:sulfur carrier protein ThiS